MDTRTDAAAGIELDGMYELHAALLEERRNIAAGVSRLRRERQQRGTFVLGDGATAAPKIVALQHQIDVVAAIIAALRQAGAEPMRAPQDADFGSVK